MSKDILNQTMEAFSDKWKSYFDNCENKEKLYKFEKERYLRSYNFSSEEDLSNFLKKKKVILDAGCGIGFKSAWFATLAPESLVIGVDFSDSIDIAREEYKDIKNLKFIKWDLSKLSDCPDYDFTDIDYITCDQVLHHIETPGKALEQFVNAISPTGEIALYVYKKKALPRELLDDFFREQCRNMSHDAIMELSEQLTELGKILSDLSIAITIPNIPALGIEGGTYDLQRFIYYNFIKCYWNKELGYETSVITNYDWYRPSIAYRYTKEDFIELTKNYKLKNICLYEEGASYSGRFTL